LLFVANNPEAVRAMAQSNNREWTKFTDLHLRSFWEVLKKLEDDKTMGWAGYIKLESGPHLSVHKYVKELKVFIDKGDLEWFSNYMFNKISTDRNFITFINDIAIKYPELIRLWSPQNMTDVLNNWTWVCRHYAVIMRNLFNGIMSKWWKKVKFSKESHMYFVENKWMSHAYSVVTYPVDNGQTRELYVDVTDYVASWWKGEIFFPKNYFSGSEKWAQNNTWNQDNPSNLDNQIFQA
jgi:hypothetical protein